MTFAGLPGRASGLLPSTLHRHATLVEQYELPDGRPALLTTVR